MKLIAWWWSQRVAVVGGQYCSVTNKASWPQSSKFKIRSICIQLKAESSTYHRCNWAPSLQITEVIASQGTQCINTKGRTLATIWSNYRSSMSLWPHNWEEDKFQLKATPRRLCQLLLLSILERWVIRSFWLHFVFRFCLALVWIVC